METTDSSQQAQSLILPVSEQKVEQCMVDFAKGYSNVFKTLDIAGREYVRKIVESCLSGEKELLTELYAVDYDHRRVDPETFFSSTDYLGHFRSSIRAAWWPHLMHVCDPANGIYECVLTGCIGAGKSTFGIGLVLAYHIHRALCLKSPATFFGLGKKSKLVFGIYATDLKEAEDVGFFILRDQILSESPFFSQVYPRTPYGTDTIHFPKNIVVQIGSKSLHAAGKNLLGVAVDEMNLMRHGATTANRAFDLANSLSRRIELRLMQTGGEIPGICVFIGSARSQTDFIEKRAKFVRGEKGKYVVSCTYWEYADEKKIHYCGKRFRVQVGGETTDSRLLDTVTGNAPENWEVIRGNEAQSGSGTIEVPVEHYNSFVSDLTGSIQDIAGVSTWSMLKFFANKEKVKSCVSADLASPFDQEIISAYVGGATELADVVNRHRLCSVKMGHFVPIRHPNSPRYIHVDLAKNQCRAGIAMVHPSSHIITVEGKDEDEEGIGHYDVLKEVEVDFCIAISAGPNKEHIDFANIRRLIFFLKRMGFWIRLVTYDSWQSEDSIQRMQEAKIRAETQSVDKSVHPYAILRSCMYGGRLKMPVGKLIFDELFCLELDMKENKIDHDDGDVASKDSSDGLCGATFRCLTDKISPTEYRREIRVEESTESKYDGYLDYLKEMSVNNPRL